MGVLELGDVRGRVIRRMIGALVALAVAVVSPAATAIARCTAECAEMPCCKDEPSANAGMLPVRECCLSKAEPRSAMRSDSVRELEEFAALAPETIALPARRDVVVARLVQLAPRSTSDLYLRKRSLLL
jgi:hypothetical protein